MAVKPGQTTPEPDPDENQKVTTDAVGRADQAEEDKDDDDKS